MPPTIVSITIATSESGRRKAARFQQHKFVEAVEEIILLTDALAAAQCIGRRRVGARRAAQAKVDAAGKERLQHLETLGHHQRCMVRQHHAARANAHIFGDRRDLPDHNVGRRARYCRQIMMLRHPIAPEGQAVGEARKIERIAQGLCGGRTGRDG